MLLCEFYTYEGLRQKISEFEIVIKFRLFCLLNLVHLVLKLKLYTFLVDFACLY